MELKYRTCYQYNAVQLRFNRTFMELKYVWYLYYSLVQ